MLRKLRIFHSTDVCFGSKADIALGPRHVRFTPERGHWRQQLVCPLCAKSGHYVVGYSIISSASAERFGGTSMPSALAVLRLMTSSSVPRRQSDDFVALAVEERIARNQHRSGSQLHSCCERGIDFAPHCSPTIRCICWPI